MYSIGQISEMFHLPISTLRYYDKEGLFPDIKRNSGIRRFGEKEIDTLQMIECLKKSGLEIKDIKYYMTLCEQGTKTYPQRKELFQKQQKYVEEEIQRMYKILDMLRFKCWYYDQAIKDGTEEHIQEMLPDKLPADIQKLFDHAHKN